MNEACFSLQVTEVPKIHYIFGKSEPTTRQDDESLQITQSRRLLSGNPLALCHTFKSRLRETILCSESEEPRSQEPPGSNSQLCSREDGGTTLF